MQQQLYKILGRRAWLLMRSPYLYSVLYRLGTLVWGVPTVGIGIGIGKYIHSRITHSRYILCTLNANANDNGLC
jgi:hypothetical protein